MPRKAGYLYRSFVFSITTQLSIFSPKTTGHRRLMNSMSRKHRDVKQDLENKWFRHSCILQKVIHWAFILHLSN